MIKIALDAIVQYTWQLTIANPDKCIELPQLLLPTNTTINTLKIVIHTYN